MKTWNLIIALIFSFASFSVFGVDLSLEKLGLGKDALGYAGLAGLEYFLGKTKWVKSNSLIELVLDIGKLLLGKKIGKTWRF